MSASPVRTTCPYCGVGCGIRASVNGSITIAGDKAHPANGGRLCSKGTHLAETLRSDGRLLHPAIGGRQSAWGEALDLVARTFNETIATHGPDSVAFYVSGQLLTEDYYVANKLMKGFIGAANIDTNSRLCMASAVAGHRRAFGVDAVPACYEDLELADLIVLVGSNTAWCHPVVFQRIAAAREARGTKIVVIDPRQTETASIADLVLQLRPGTDVKLFNGLLAHLVRTDAVDADYMNRHVRSPAGFLERVAEENGLAEVAAACDLPVGDLHRFYEWFASTPRTVTCFSQGVNQSSAGTDKVNSIINCHLATGRVGRPGASPFSLTGQPNAMGGREVGGLANQLAAHLSFDSLADIDLLSRFWGSRNVARRPGLKAVDMFEAVRSGRIKALWVMATNPAVSLPQLGDVHAALAACPFVVVSDCIAATDTTRFAHVLLPARAWGEKDGTVTNSERCISRQRAFLPAPGEAQPDWWIVTQVARRMGHERAFPYEAPAAIFREHAALSGFENDGARCFDIGAYTGVSDEAYESLTPFQWPAPARDLRPQPRLFGDGQFSTPDGKAAIVPVAWRAPGNAPDERFGLVLNTGRLRDQWHTMTRTGLSPRLSSVAEPFVQIHPDDARDGGVRDGGLAAVVSRYGRERFRVVVTAAQRRGEIFSPIHWNREFASGGRVGALVNAVCDPVSGQPEFKHTPVRIEDYAPRWTGFLLSRTAPDLSAVDYWARAAVRGGCVYELAGDADPRSLIDKLFPSHPDIERVEMIDGRRGVFRLAALRAGKLLACLFIAPPGQLPVRDWLLAQFAEPANEDASSMQILAAGPAHAVADVGAIVCVCFNVGVKTLMTAIQNEGLVTLADVGQALQAGTNCGSCRPAIQSLLSSSRAAAE